MAETTDAFEKQEPITILFDIEDRLFLWCTWRIIEKILTRGSF